MTTLTFTGKVEYDKWGNPDSVVIEGKDVLEEITDVFGYGKNGITVGLGNETFTGKLDVEEGSAGYSTWTPGESAMFYCGGIDILDKLEEMNGQTVRLVVTDNPDEL